MAQASAPSTICDVTVLTIAAGVAVGLFALCCVTELAAHADRYPNITARLKRAVRR